jgi:hypothetical protein
MLNNLDSEYNGYILNHPEWAKKKGLEVVPYIRENYTEIDRFDDMRFSGTYVISLLGWFLLTVGIGLWIRLSFGI